MSDPEIALIFTPPVLSLLSSYLFGHVGTGYQKAWFEPPGYVFGIVWLGLYIMFGFLLYESAKREQYTVLGLVIGTLFLTYAWQYFFSYKKYYKLAVFIIFLTLLIGLELLVELIISNWERVYLFTYVPFVAWITFALILSSHTRLKK